MELLYTRLVEREIEQMDRFTIAVATGTGISWGGKDAYDAWLKSRGKGGPSADGALAQRATIGRLAAMFPGAVKQRKAD